MLGASPSAQGGGTTPVTQLLADWDQGDPKARDRLFGLLYDDLLHIARRQRQRFRPHHTLNTTALVHELYLKLADQSGVVAENRAHFTALATKALRCVVLDYLRRMGRHKRGGNAAHVGLHDVEPALPTVEAEADQIMALDGALEELEALDAEMASVVEMHFFAGLSYEEIAAIRGVSAKTIYRTMAKAKVLLRRALDA